MTITFNEDRPIQIGILCGSARQNGNTPGIATWVQTHLDSILSTRHGSKAEPQMISLTQPPLPLGPLYDDIIPKALSGTPNEDGTISYPYPSARTREFSLMVQKLDALIIVSPQYNWSIPGELKNTIDHLYHEWVNLPISVITYGGRGGDKAAEAFKPIIAAIESLPISVGEIMIPLDKRTYIVGNERVDKEDHFLKQYEATLKDELSKIIEAAENRKQARA